ncbi:MAG TPA: hypothetical protein VM871_10265 [Flavisolibacter sp.]|jgi:hypothetical protein|nr:hypothetical protein [Flavisolibacter sp.]
MKQLLPILLFSLIPPALQAQGLDMKKFKEDAVYRNNFLQRFNNKAVPDTPVSLSIHPITGQLKPGLHRLLPDGMPCIVPETKDIVAIPNAWRGKVGVPFTGNPPRIPNPSPTMPQRYSYKAFALPDSKTKR